MSKYQKLYHSLMSCLTCTYVKHMFCLSETENNKTKIQTIVAEIKTREHFKAHVVWHKPKIVQVI